MPVINFENLKTEKPERNFDNVPLDENANIGIQNGQQIYGVKKFFLAVKDAIDWISSIAGNKNFTGEVSMGGKKLATEEAVNNALKNYQKVFSSGYIDTVTIKKIKRDTNNRAFRFYCRGGETVFLYQGSELIANREVDGYKKISLAYDTNYFYVTFASNAQYCYIESFYGDMEIETITTVPSSATNIEITSTDVNNALTYQKLSASGSVGVNISSISYKELIVEIATTSTSFCFNINKEMLSSNAKYFRDGFYYNANNNAMCTVDCRTSSVTLSNLFINNTDEKANATINVYYR